MDENIPTPKPVKHRLSRKQAELATLRAANAALEARLSALETAKASTSTQDIVAALREDREQVRSAALQRELDEAYRQIDHLKRPQTPEGPGIAYHGWVQAKEDSWDMTGYHLGPKDGQPGAVFMVNMPDYWPGCPFTPVVIVGTKEDGVTPIVAPHPDFQSH